MRTPQRRTRRLLLVAALVLGIGGYAGVRTLGQRANRFRQLAQFHARRASMFEKSITSKTRAAQGCEEFGGDRMLRIAAEYRAEVKLCVKLAAYHSRMHQKYEHAASHAWLPIGADPPEPAPD